MAERYMLIGCAVMYREICLCAAQSKNIIDFEFMDKGLHDIGEKAMSNALQQVIDSVDTQKYSAILLCYGLCNYGVKGLHAKIPLVIPKAHDCITLFMGSKEKYSRYFNSNPGTYYRTSGWIERGSFGLDGEEDVMSQLGIKPGADYSQYGEENAKYLMEMLGNWTSNYTKQTFIDTGVGDVTVYEAMVEEEAKARGLDYESIKGDPRLIRLLMDGDWDEAEFLVVPPGNKITAAYDDAIMSYQVV